jgi:pyruvate/2-oxoglutarate dehydrogenase complex dihydrolipoamide acyltransferase (E2) component
VPVGNVIATISESADAPSEETAEEKSPADKVPVAADTTVDGKTVIMPALGMAQDTGLLIAWHKEPGDAVAASEILLEVETDKSAMEVEAGHDGYVAELRAEAGENVPVGEVIAIISTERPKAPTRKSAGSKPQEPAREPSTQKKAAPVSSTGSKSASRASKASLPATNGRVLASPKARRLAVERGLDLALLARSGHPQPYHVADLDRLAELSAEAPWSRASGAQRDHVTARVPAAGFVAFKDWFAQETGQSADDLAVWAAFATASIRESADTEAVTIRAESPTLRRSAVFLDADLKGFTDTAEVEEPGSPSLLLRDLTGGRITVASFAADSGPVLTIGRDGGDFVLTLDAPADTLKQDTALQLVSEMAARLEEPLRHLL